MQFISKIIGSGPTAIPTVPPSSCFNYKDANYYNYFRKLEKQYPHNEYAIRNKSGLISTTQNDNVFALNQFDIVGEITDSSVSTVFTQKYDNNSKVPVEAKYAMPLPPYATVCDFMVEFDGKVLKGKIKENQKAQEQYSDSIASGGQAFLAERTNDGFFNLQIGNLPPGKSVTISITIISEIGSHLESLHYCLHRFMFPEGSFKLNCKLSVQLSSPISKIELEGYSTNIKYSKGKKSANIEFSSTGVKKNIIAMILPDSSSKPEYFIEHSKSDNTYAVALNFYPEFKINKEEVEQKAEFIFLLDCSGSMSGAPIQNAKRALEIIMRSLNENVKFNIYLFGTSFKKLFTQSRMYDDDSLAEASNYIESIGANLGGTELLPPVQDILNSQYDPEYPKQLFILTDGEVSNRDKLIDYVGKESNSTRIFTLGIGGGVDIELVVGLSKACKGYYELIKESSKIETQVLSLLSISMEPTLSNIKVNWNSDMLKVIQAPKLVRPIYRGERMMIYGLIESKLTTDNQVTITLTGNGPSGKLLSFPVELNFSEDSVKSDSNQIHTLTAYNIIKDLEEDERKLKKDNKDEIVRYGKKYRLISAHTSFLVTAESDQVTQDTMQSVDVMKPQIQQQQQQFIPPPPNYPTQYLSRSSSIGSVPLPQRSSGCPPPPPPPSSSPLSSISYNGPPPPLGPPPPPGGSYPTSNSYGAIPPPPPPGGAYPTSNSYSPIPPSPGGGAYPTSTKSSQSIVPNLSEQIQSYDSFSGPMKRERKSSNEGSRNQFSKQSSPSSSSPRSLTIGTTTPPPPPSQPKSTGDLLMDLIKAQKANGSWSTSSITLQVPSIPDSLSKLLPEVWTTLFVIAKIQNQFKDKSSQWDLVVQKAIKWVKSQLNKENLTDSFDNFSKLAQSSL